MIVIITRTPFRSSLIQISIPPKIRISDFVRTIKSITERLLKKRFEYMRPSKIRSQSILGDRRHMIRWLFSPEVRAYAEVSTIGIDEVVIKKYIERQYKEDVGQAKLALDLFDCVPPVS